MAKSPDVAEQLRAFLRDLEGESSFNLMFSYNGTDYKTAFKASHKGAGTEREEIKVDNGCINMTFGYTIGPPDKPEKQTFVNGFIGGIQAEDGKVGTLPGLEGKLACFNPVLATNGRNAVRKSGKRTTAGDVLQILKSKLGLAFPVVRHPTPSLELVDSARNEAVKKDRGSPTMISPFHLVRGGNAYYEKYGYRSPAITTLKRDILGATWVECSPIAQAVILECTGKADYRPGDLLVDIMTGISWDEERAYNELPWNVELAVEEPPRKAGPDYKIVPSDDHYVYEFDKTPSLSSIVFREFAHSQGTTARHSYQWTILPSIWTFTLEPDSEDWKRCDAELVLTGFSATAPANAAGGAGKGLSRRARRNRRRITRKRVYRLECN